MDKTIRFHVMDLDQSEVEERGSQEVINWFILLLLKRCYFNFMLYTEVLGKCCLFIYF